MQSLNKGRAIIHDRSDHIEIIIPTKINFAILLLPLFIIAMWWSTGGDNLVHAISSKDKVTNIDWFGMGWEFVIIFISLINSIWILIGNETVRVWVDVLSIKKQYIVYPRTTAYDLHEAKYFRAEEDIRIRYRNSWDNIGDKLRNFYNEGTIRFEYGAKTIKFGEVISEAEGAYILQLLRDKKLLTDKNFA